jgi:YHS domain-containing protein
MRSSPILRTRPHSAFDLRFWTPYHDDLLKQKKSFAEDLRVHGRHGRENVSLFDFLLGLSRPQRLCREESGMKRLVHALTTAFVISVIAAGIDAANASDNQTSDPAQNGSNVSAPNATPEEAKGRTTTKVNVDDQGVILKGYDAVAYFKQGKSVKGNPTIESTYQGATYLFSSSANKADFEKDPGKYAPQYGAFCSYGVANGVLADLDTPGAFVLYKGKLYLCGNEGALKAFKSNIDSNIDKADTNWQRLAPP